MSKTFRTMASIAGTMAILPAASMADGPKFSGFVTGSYIYDLADPVSGNINQGYTKSGGEIYTNFYGGRNASIKADAAHLTITGGDSAGASYTIDLDAGSDGVATGGNLATASGWAFDVQQAFVSVPFGKTPLGLQVGKFYTSEGIEVGNSAADPTVTRGLAFGALEYTAATGALITFKANDQISGAIGAVTSPFSNSVWQYDGGNGIPVGYAKVALAYGDPFAGTISAYFGPQGGADSAGPKPTARKNYLSLDLTGVTKAIASLDLNFQANYLMRSKAGNAGKDWTGFLVGLQPLYHMGAAQVGLRAEYLSIDDGSGTTYSVTSIALAPGYKLTQNTLLRAEYRIDLASEKIFEDDKGAGNTKTDQLVGGELNYTF